MKSNRFMVLLLCILVLIGFVGCRQSIDSICADWQREGRTNAYILEKAEEIHEIRPDLVTAEDVRRAREKYKAHMEDPLAGVCILQKVIEEQN